MRARSAHVAVRLRDLRGLDPDEELVLGPNRTLDVLDPQPVRRPEAIVDDGSHGEATTVSTTFPTFWPVSTYLVASTTSSSG
jgi:hypothetical protein